MKAYGIYKTEKMKNGGFLPYYKGKTTQHDRELAVYLRHKFLPLVKRKFPQHFLVNSRPSARLSYIREQSKTHRYFLRFDIAAFYPSITPDKMAGVLLDNYTRLSGKVAPARMKQRLWLGFGRFFERQPYPFGLPLGTGLSAITGPAFLLGLCCSLQEYPLVCYQDDFLVFLRTKKEIDHCMQVVLAELNFLGLELNPRKVSSGRFAQSSVTFTGYRYAGGCFGIEAERIERFRAAIVNLTSLKRRYKNITAFIKQLNCKINGFGHYYKHASVRLVFAKMDGFIRSRVRRFVCRVRRADNHQANLDYTNDYLHNELRLRSLVLLFDGIKPKSGSKKSSKIAGSLAPSYSLGAIEELLRNQNAHLRKLIAMQHEVVFALQ
jgi:hypothetical protein